MGYVGLAGHLKGCGVLVIAGRHKGGRAPSSQDDSGLSDEDDPPVHVPCIKVLVVLVHAVSAFWRLL